MNFFKRLYEDFFKRSRLAEYKRLLSTAKENGFRMMGIYDFFVYVSSGQFKESDKILINRHDVDTSPRVARLMFDIEREVFGHQGSSTFYFRMCTLDRELVNDIDKYGYETGFHYETIANYIKKNRLKDLATIRKNFPSIEKQFLKEISDYRRKTGNSSSKTISSHGDFLNVRLNIPNYELLKNDSLRRAAGVRLEAYDHSINMYVQKRFADQVLVERFSEEVIGNLNGGIIMILTHPRQWKVDFFWNLKDNFKRLLDGIKYGNLRRV